LAEKDARSNQVKDALDQERAKQGETLESAKRQWISERMELERQLEDAKRNLEEGSNKASREKAQLLDAERTLREQLKILQERLQNTQQDSRRNDQLHSATTATAGELHSLKDAVVAMMSEVKGMDMEKKQLEMKAEHEKQLIGLERKFQRQLMEARRKNEGLIESLRQTYEDEVDGLKTQRSELIARSKDLEKEIERCRGEVEVLKQRNQSAENEQALQRRFIETSHRQAELVTAFLERCPRQNNPELASMHEELGALTVGGGGPRGGAPNSHGGYGGGYSGGGGGGAGGYSAANASVFRNIPGI